MSAVSPSRVRAFPLVTRREGLDCGWAPSPPRPATARHIFLSVSDIRPSALAGSAIFRRLVSADTQFNQSGLQRVPAPLRHNSIVAVVTGI